ncbi:MAG: histidine phosphatase family protein [Saprospiraceae bacterium]|nr:histidine phosphatase family protein [Saprospiraceae bacterium]
MNVYINFILLIVISVSQFACSSKQAPKDTTIEADAPVCFLVRHAEKADLSADAELSEAGKERTLELAKFLRSANIEYVHSSDFIRTRETAAPTANEFGLTTEIYDPDDLEELAHKIRAKGGNHLIVGHSNTTPEMVKLLGGDPGSQINEAGEFDRLYIVYVPANSTGKSILMRYGTPYILSSDN